MDDDDEILEGERHRNLRRYKRLKELVDQCPLTVAETFQWLEECAARQHTPRQVEFSSVLTVMRTHVALCWEWAEERMKAEEDMFKSTCPFGLPQGEKV